GPLSNSPQFIEGLRRVEVGMSGKRIALMCSEENPAICHRHLLIGRCLSKRGIDPIHIRGDGGTEKESDINARETGESGGDSQLFETPTVLLCSEDTPEHCHRRLVLEYLNEKWGNTMNVIHL